LLIVVVVIAILASITIVSYNGIQTKARNTSNISEIKSWQTSFELYRAQFGAYPVVPDGGYCLGRGFPVGGGGQLRCGDFTQTDHTSYAEADNAGLMAELAKVGSIPSSPKTPTNGSVGPYAMYSSTKIDIIAILRGAACPANLTTIWEYNSTLWCAVTLMK
jgi:type II secretory pathway pseudopilin PulG